MSIIQKIVLKYKNPDEYWAQKGQVYVGSLHPCNALNCIEWKDVETAVKHSTITSEPTEVKILNITIEESNP